MIHHDPNILLEHRVIFDSSPALIWYKDRANRILRVNKPAAASIGRAVEDLEGHLTDEFYPDDAARYYADDLEVIRSGAPKLGIIETMVDARGQTKCVRTDKIPYRDAAGEIIGVIVFALDITDQKLAEENARRALEQAERANRAKTEFLANISHELRTPLGVMMGFSELLATEHLDSASRVKLAGKIQDNGARLMRLIDELLDLSRIEQGRMELEHLNFRLGDLISDVTSIMALKAREKNIAFEVTRDAGVPDRIVSDPMRLRQILFNVIGNAIKFTDAGQVSVAVGVELLDSSRIRILVKDTGKGILPESLAGLFQPFYQTDPSDARKYGGTGLGLALSRHLARNLGGDLTLVTSTAGMGSSFLITVASSPLTAPAINSKTAMPVTARPTFTRPIKIILAEDNADIQEMVRHYLDVEGLSLVIVDNGRLAVDQAMMLGADLVLMDLQLPELDGVSAVRELRRRGFVNPILAMTAHAMEGQKRACLDAGFTDFLSKPVTRSELLGRIHASLANLG